MARRASAGLSATVSWLRETVNAAGWLLLLAVVVGVVLGLSAGLVEAWAIAGIAAALLLMSIPFLLGGHDYRINLQLDRDRVIAGSEVNGHIDIGNRSARVSLPGIVDIPVGDGLVEAHVPLLLAGAEHREQLTIAAKRRGIIDVDRRAQHTDARLAREQRAPGGGAVHAERHAGNNAAAVRCDLLPKAGRHLDPVGARLSRAYDRDRRQLIEKREIPADV